MSALGWWVLAFVAWLVVAVPVAVLVGRRLRHQQPPPSRHRCAGNPRARPSSRHRWNGDPRTRPPAP